MQSLRILYTFVLRAEIATIFGPNVVGISHSEVDEWTGDEC